MQEPSTADDTQVNRRTNSRESRRSPNYGIIEGCTNHGAVFAEFAETVRMPGRGSTPYATCPLSH